MCCSTRSRSASVSTRRLWTKRSQAVSSGATSQPIPARVAFGADELVVHRIGERVGELHVHARVAVVELRVDAARVLDQHRVHEVSRHREGRVRRAGRGDLRRLRARLLDDDARRDVVGAQLVGPVGELVHVPAHGLDELLVRSRTGMRSTALCAAAAQEDRTSEDQCRAGQRRRSETPKPHLLPQSAPRSERASSPVRVFAPNSYQVGLAVPRQDQPLHAAQATAACT